MHKLPASTTTGPTPAVPLTVTAQAFAQMGWPNSGDTLERLGHAFLALAPLVREAERTFLPPPQPVVCIWCGDDITNFNAYQRQAHERKHPLRVKVRQWFAS